MCRADVGDDGTHEILHGGEPGNNDGDVLGTGFGIRNVYRGVSAAEPVFAVVGNQVVMHGFPRSLLVGVADRSPDVDAAGIGFILEFVVHQHTDEFGRVFGVYGFNGCNVCFGFLILGNEGSRLFVLVGGFVDVTQVAHTAQDVVFAHGGALGVHDRVVGRGCDGEPRNRRRFSDGEFI